VSGWLLDTNVISELRRRKPEPLVLAFVAGQVFETLFVSSVTFVEIRFGIERLADSARRAELNDWLTHTLRPMFQHRVLQVTEDVLLKWRLLMEEGRRVGHTYPEPDLIIGVIALQHGLTLVTRDTADFEKARIDVFNPWTATLSTAKHGPPQ
jgi:predicted nucleic acid-binding protein